MNEVDEIWTPDAREGCRSCLQVMIMLPIIALLFAVLFWDFLCWIARL